MCLSLFRQYLFGNLLLVTLVLLVFIIICIIIVGAPLPYTTQLYITRNGTLTCNSTIYNAFGNYWDLP